MADEVIHAAIYGEIALERLRQDHKWGEQNHGRYKWLAILGEEYGEACEAALNLDGNYRNELIQIAAVAVAAIESSDRSQSNDEGPND